MGIFITGQLVQYNMFREGFSPFEYKKTVARKQSVRILLFRTINNYYRFVFLNIWFITTNDRLHT